MAEKAKLIIDILETLAPKGEALSWDNVGLQVGDQDSFVKKALICLDVNDKVLDEAIENGCQMIVTHHPLIFKPIKSILKNEVKGNIIYRAIKNNINIYSAHTNIDIVEEGLNDFICYKLGFSNTQFLETINSYSYVKLVVFVPEDCVDTLAEVLGDAGAGHIGNYSNCSFRASGIGTFKPLTGSNPYIGEEGQVELVKEVRLETIVEESKLNHVIEEMVKAHPYEEVAYDIYPLAIKKPKNGIGRVADLDSSVPTTILIENIKASLGIENLRFIGDINRAVNRIAVINGSGADYIGLAAAAKCDCLLTGDIKYHEAQLALDLGVNVIDIGHYESEIHFIELVTDYLNSCFSKTNIDVEVIASRVYNNPFQYL
ncbi:Nif3-like dinuclear metal center hexameric protein [Alkaliphilus pronyensis]|uniref:GTP cyclohydrolase 1 type 2 homolog n=1 Tax=Alkaliphilus pronyensis TaxID=1482732 RepID=A0A6I0FHK0_9FIRM|nr:Nif3-like dinuclear metal center hexameric protein [Alkaliphilus pronyensis]KAB3538627.1 Nif3-like dinuclear metal center hexameric protein [Alkaliphilus pronyensis]